MKKEWQIIIFIISAVIISICFGVYDYLNFEESTIEFSPSESKTVEVNEDLHSIEKYENSATDLSLPKNITIITTNEMTDDIEIRKDKINQSKNILKFVSKNNDFENETKILKTNYDTTFHEFDFDNKTITMKNPTIDDKWQIIVFHWTSIKKLDNGIIEFNIKNDKGVHQIWRSSANNIGYEFYNKTKLVFYDVSRVN